MAFTIIINLYTKAGKDVEDQVRAMLIEAANKSTANPGILGWYPMQSTTDPRKWTVIHRYDDESSLEENRAHPASKAFGEALEPLLENGKDSLDAQVSKELL